MLQLIQCTFQLMQSQNFKLPHDIPIFSSKVLSKTEWLSYFNFITQTKRPINTQRESTPIIHHLAYLERESEKEKAID